MGLEHRSGLMALNMKESGDSTKLMAKASSGMLTVTYTRVFGKTTKRTGTESTFMSMVLSTKATGSTIFKTAKELSLGVTAVNTKEDTKKE